jgi:hypothetical protein
MAGGHLSDGLWAGWEVLLANLVHTPGGVQLWGEHGYVFGTDFQPHDAGVMARDPDPRAKAFGVISVTRFSNDQGSVSAD